MHMMTKKKFFHVTTPNPSGLLLLHAHSTSKLFIHLTRKIIGWQYLVIPPVLLLLDAVLVGLAVEPAVYPTLPVELRSRVRLNLALELNAGVAAHPHRRRAYSYQRPDCGKEADGYY